MGEIWQEIREHVGAACTERGLDLVHAFRVGSYNNVVDEALRIADFGRPQALALVVGNTRALWPRFLSALRADCSLLEENDPIDQYTERNLRESLAGVEMRCEVRWAHEGPPRLVAMQRLAHVAGLAYRAPCNLSIHPVYGPWIALRAVVVVDADGPEGSELPSPCGTCETHCMPALDVALAESGRAALATGTPPATALWKSWLAVRDACPLGREHRYSDEQIRYHYTKDRGVLRAAVRCE